MLRSLTRRLKLETGLNVGIALSRSHLAAVALEEASGKPRVAWKKYTAFNSSIFEPNPAKDIGNTLYEALSPLAKEINGELHPLHIVMPDTVIRSATFELDDLPKSKPMLASLACWKSSTEFGRAEDELECKTTNLGVVNDKHLLFVQAGDRFWLDKIRDSLHSSEIIPWTINSAAFFRFNHVMQQRATPASALLSVDEDCWTLQLWDADNRIRLTVTRVRRSNGCDDHGIITNELNRVLLAWRHKAADIELNTLYMDGQRSCLEKIQEGLQTGLCRKIIINGSGDSNMDAVHIGESPLMSLAFMAAKSA